MKITFFISLLSLFATSCNSTTESFGQTVVHYDTTNEHIIESGKEIKTDSCILRFLSDFKDDKIAVLSDSNSQTANLTTKRSLAYAGSIKIKNNGQRIVLQIAETRFSFLLNKDYLFIDISFERIAKRIDIYFSNNIFILS